MGESTRETLRHFIQVMLQREADFEPKPDLDAVLDKLDLMMSRMTQLIRTGVTVLIKSVEMSTLAMGYRHYFSNLPPAEQEEYLNKMERSSTYAFRAIIMGVKTLVFLVYFSQPEAEKAVGFDGKCLFEK